jgi:hypothetical protein
MALAFDHWLAYSGCEADILLDFNPRQSVAVQAIRDRQSLRIAHPRA